VFLLTYREQFNGFAAELFLVTPWTCTTYGFDLLYGVRTQWVQLAGLSRLSTYPDPSAILNLNRARNRSIRIMSTITDYEKILLTHSHTHTPPRIPNNFEAMTTQHPRKAQLERA